MCLNWLSLSSRLINSFLLLSMQRTKSTSDLGGPEVNGTANQEERIQFAAPELGDLTRKNWTYLTNEVIKCELFFVFYTFIHLTRLAK